jgi:uncharacterized metal-binding protein YceD (DUF177 family)
LGKFDAYKIDLKSLSAGVHNYEYTLDNKFFSDIDGQEVSKGKVQVALQVRRSQKMSEMTFRLEGIVYVPCDRCLDDMEIPVESNNLLVVKFGKEYSEESDEIVVIPEAEGEINLAWFLYEFVALAIPMKHIHPPGGCNKQMTAALKKHTARSSENYEGEEGEDVFSEEDGAPTSDPRWDALRGLAENENDNN